jgi:hypothetical protein
MSDPTVFVVLKEGTSHGTPDGTPLCVELTEETARHRKIGRCVRYVPEQVFRDERQAKRAFADALADLVQVGRQLRPPTEGTDECETQAWALFARLLSKAPVLFPEDLVAAVQRAKSSKTTP